jgi:hypothetical protein
VQFLSTAPGLNEFASGSFGITTNTTNSSLSIVSKNPVPNGQGVGASFTTGLPNLFFKAVTSGLSTGGINVNTDFCPQNFWIGPSDAVKLATTSSQSVTYTPPSGKSPASSSFFTNTMTVDYTFTLINEV